MQDKQKETERSNEQPGSMDSYNNREDNRAGRVEETKGSENEDAKTEEKHKHPDNTAIPEEE